MAESSAPWWRDAVMYQVYLRSFADGTGDGIGDLPGVRARLPYLRELGVDGLWLTPWYPSPMKDGGYDVADYTDIEPLFGTLEDARGLVDDAHALGLKVIVDFVANHTSDEHRLVPGGAGRRAGQRRAGPLPLPRRPGRARRAGRRTTGSAPSVARPGPGSPSRTARSASGTCTSSRRPSRT